MDNHSHPWHNLAIQGGGIRTFVFHGALAALEEAGALQHIDRVAGTSAGAMLGALLCFRLPVRTTLDYYARLEMRRVPQLTSNDDMEPEWSLSLTALQSQLKGLTHRTATLSRLVSNYGWYSTGYAYNWIRSVIASQCDGNGSATFADFRERGFRDLYVVTANVSQARGEVFSAENTPDAPVAAALLLSQSIPLFFEAMRFDGKELGKGDYYADGGIVNNYPVELFDHPRYMEHGDVLQSGLNWQTLGLHHYTPSGIVRADRPIRNLLTYMENIATMLLNTQALKLNLHDLNLKRTIQISNLGISATDFTVVPIPGNPVYDKLVAEGYRATQAYLAAIKPSYPDLAHRASTA